MKKVKKYLHTKLNYSTETKLLLYQDSPRVKLTERLHLRFYRSMISAE